ncbi:MAG: hypothetical protein Q3M24_20125 [Candidatus Electrothrix aestuarii]|uniref:Uncharacterized protein n=1 Tax=Candidatus Electrothrix aestuarii TaxID=3062594 RepID=A0AAU8LTS9_9BACT|nr:hypothetical protein [Candidatus Electrothrix aestuarii]
MKRLSCGGRCLFFAPAVLFVDEWARHTMMASLLFNNWQADAVGSTMVEPGFTP